jgi:hypothetical protein
MLHLEGCTAPSRDENCIAAVVELIDLTLKTNIRQYKTGILGK